LLHPVLEYLRGLHKNLIQPFIFSVVEVLRVMTANRLHFANIAVSFPTALPQPNPFLLQPPPQAPDENQSALKVIAGNIWVIRDTMERQHLRELAAEDARRDQSSGWDKKPELV
jgi:hypothetical protein